MIEKLTIIYYYIISLILSKIAPSIFESKFFISESKKDIENNWSEFWTPILMDNKHSNSGIDVDAVKRELFDYWVVMNEVGKVYCELTGGNISKPNTRSEVVIDFANEHFCKYCDLKKEESSYSGGFGPVKVCDITLENLHFHCDKIKHDCKICEINKKSIVCPIKQDSIPQEDMEEIVNINRV